MKLRRRRKIAKSENDRVYLTQADTSQNQSKVGRIVWKFVKGTWKVVKTGFQTAVVSQPYSFALEPTALATTIVEYQTRRRERQ